MGNAKSITEAYEEWEDDSGDVGQLREFIARNKQHIEEQNFIAQNPAWAEEESKCPALMKACKDGKVKVVDELIQAGADLTAADEVYLHILSVQAFLLTPCFIGCLLRHFLSFDVFCSHFLFSDTFPCLSYSLFPYSIQ